MSKTLPHTRDKRVSLVELEVWEKDSALGGLSIDDLRCLRKQLGRTMFDLNKIKTNCQGELGLPPNKPVRVYHGYMGPHHNARHRRAKQGIPTPSIHLPAYAFPDDPSILKLQIQQILPRYHRMIIKVNSEIEARNQAVQGKVQGA